MGCCKAEEFLVGCNERSVVYKDAEDKDYCVFHAPKGKKGLSLDEFNKKIFERINEAAKVETVCNLQGVVFEGDINFGLAFINKSFPEVNFGGAIFSGEALFSTIRFEKRVGFYEVVFKKRTDFTVATFSQVASFTGATFEGDGQFLAVTFENAAIFSDVTFHGRVDFSLCKFYSNSLFREGKKKVFLHDVIMNIDSIKERIKFEGIDLSKVFFGDTDVRKMDFINCVWAGNKSGRNVLYDEVLAFGEVDIKGDKQESNNKETLKKVEVLYRRMKQKYINEHDWPEVSNWHYGEREMFRKGNSFRRFFPLSISNIYRMSSGYGEMPGVAGITLVVLILGVTFFMVLSGMEPVMDGPEWVKDLTGLRKLGAYVLNTLQYVTFQKISYFSPTSLLGEYIKLFARIVIPIQSALLAFSLRNKFRR